MPVTVVGCGDVRLATAQARGTDPRDVVRTVHEALELGVRLVDVAEDADAERMCADAIRSLRLRDVVVLASRIRVVAPLPGRPDRDVLPERLPPRYVQERVESTLRATRLDFVPLVQLPLRIAWRTSTAWPELVGTCARLVHEGKVMSFAAALDTTDVTTATDVVDFIATEPWLAALAVTYNACARLDDTILDGKLPIIARQPLAGGALAGILGPGVRLAPNDDRRTIDDATLARIATAAATLSRLVKHEPPAARSCEGAKAALDLTPRPDHLEANTVAELALRYVCDRAIALPRLHERQHLAEAIAAASAPPLSRVLRDRIDEVLKNLEPNDE